MSTFDQRVQVVRDFLIGRARLRRTTTFQEIGVATGEALAKYRTSGSTKPMSRQKVAAALSEVARTSLKENGFILPAIVVHWNDNRPGHRYAEWVSKAGLSSYGEGNHATQVKKVFAKYAPNGDPFADAPKAETNGTAAWENEDDDGEDLEADEPSTDEAGDRNDDRVESWV